MKLLFTEKFFNIALNRSFSTPKSFAFVYIQIDCILMQYDFLSSLQMQPFVYVTWGHPKKVPTWFNKVFNNKLII